MSTDQIISDAPILLRPLTLRGVTMKNRIMIAPMAMYSANDGFADDFHLVQLGRFALGGAGLVMTEAVAVNREGRITHGCLGLWHNAQIAGLMRIAEFVRRCGSVPGIQLAHAGRKASTLAPWHGGTALSLARETGAAVPWQALSSTAEPFDDTMSLPEQLDEAGISRVIIDFADAAARADAAGYDVLEIHCAHGYLLHSFLSPLVNNREDRWGGDLEGRMRLPLEVVRAVRQIWPEQKPLFVRISSIDGVEVGWSIDDSIMFANELKQIGVDVIDCSSGGMKLPRGKTLAARAPGFQVSFSNGIRNATGLATVAVGLIQSPRFANDVLDRGQADIVAIAREALFNPNWPNHAAVELESEKGWKRWPEQFSSWLSKRARGMTTVDQTSDRAATDNQRGDIS
jgi:2,4-dienoyl-CoA reductase-like NADH-dependent reductase (Old Yellow Enzyme family)